MLSTDIAVGLVNVGGGFQNGVNGSILVHQFEDALGK